MDSLTLKRAASSLDEEKVEAKRTRQEDVVVEDDQREIDGKYVAGSRKSPVSVAVINIFIVCVLSFIG